MLVYMPLAIAQSVGHEVTLQHRFVERTCKSEAACWAAEWLGPALRHTITEARQPPRHI